MKKLIRTLYNLDNFVSVKFIDGKEEKGRIVEVRVVCEDGLKEIPDSYKPPLPIHKHFVNYTVEFYSVRHDFKGHTSVQRSYATFGESECKLCTEKESEQMIKTYLLRK